ncbi:MAG: hypothetical protein AB2A00_18590, partial [Myxococcota bacterium]
GAADAGRRRDGGTVGEEGRCDPFDDDCLPGLYCLQLDEPTGPRCFRTCSLDPDAGPTNCGAGRDCYQVNTEVNLCFRTNPRDGDCLDSAGQVDPLAVCEGGGQALVDNTQAPTICACKLLCTFANCPGPACECPVEEECIGGVLGSDEIGVCGVPLGIGESCPSPSTYPFYSSEYCAPAEGIPPALQGPLPYCAYNNPTEFEPICWLLCQYPTGSGSVVTTCPPGTRCLPAPEAFIPEVKACIPIPYPDAGAPPDAATPDATTPDAATN